jgi:hypothetical protein
MSVSGSGGDDDLEFFDVESFSFSDLRTLENVPLARGVQFDPVVTICGGSQIPLAAGDGFWDTLQYEEPESLGDSARSLSLHDLDEDEGSMHSLNESSVSASGGNRSMSLSELTNSPVKAPATAAGGDGMLKVAAVALGGRLQRFVAKTLSEEDDDDLIVHDDIRSAAQNSFHKSSSHNLGAGIFEQNPTVAQTGALNQQVSNQVGQRALGQLQYVVSVSGDGESFARLV